MLYRRVQKSIQKLTFPYKLNQRFSFNKILPILIFGTNKRPSTRIHSSFYDYFNTIQDTNQDTNNVSDIIQNPPLEKCFWSILVDDRLIFLKSIILRSLVLKYFFDFLIRHDRYRDCDQPIKNDDDLYSDRTICKNIENNYQSFCIFLKKHLILLKGFLVLRFKINDSIENSIIKIEMDVEIDNTLKNKNILNNKNENIKKNFINEKETHKPKKDNKLDNSYYDYDNYDYDYGYDDYENDFLTLSSFNNLIMEKSCPYSEQNSYYDPRLTFYDRFYEVQGTSYDRIYDERVTSYDAHDFLRYPEYPKIDLYDHLYDNKIKNSYDQDHFLIDQDDFLRFPINEDFISTNWQYDNDSFSDTIYVFRDANSGITYNKVEKINLYCQKVKKNFPIAKTTLQRYSYSNNPSTVKITHKKKTLSKNINSENLSCDNNINSQDNACQENTSSFQIQKAEDVFAPYAHLWTFCENCERSIYKQYAQKNKYICKHCEFHLPMESSDRIESLIDLGTWDPTDETMVSINPYDEVLREKRKEEDLKPFFFLNGLLFLDLEDLLLKENLDLSPILEMKEFLEITGFKEAQAYQIIGAFHQLREYLKMVARVEDERDDNDIMMTVTNDKIIIYEKIIIEKYEKEFEDHINLIPVDVKDDLIFFSYLQVPYQIQFYYYLNRNEEQFTPEQTVTDGEEQTVTDGEEQTATDGDQSTPEQTSGDGDPSIPEQYQDQDIAQKYKQYLYQEQYLDLPEEYKQYLYGAEEYTVKETVKELLERFTSANNEDFNQNSEKSTKSEEDTTESESEESDISYEEEDILYMDKVHLNQKDTGLTDAVQTGIGQLDSIPVALAVMDFQFIGGSMGSVVGEKITRLIEYATYKSLPLIICCASGGARMQEGSFSLMQMAKISSVLLNYQLNKNLFLVSLLTSPTTGGVTASFGMLGNIIIGEPDAIIAFAGKRVIEEIMKIEVPEGIQEAEYLFEKGSLDSIVPRNLLKGVLSELLKFHSFFPLNKN